MPCRPARVRATVGGLVLVPLFIYLDLFFGVAVEPPPRRVPPRRQRFPMEKRMVRQLRHRFGPFTPIFCCAMWLSWYPPVRSPPRFEPSPVQHLFRFFISSHRPTWRSPKKYRFDHFDFLRPKARHTRRDLPSAHAHQTNPILARCACLGAVARCADVQRHRLLE